MPRGITPTRVRRRQSDAKWRASVAMCYNIMKNVIPNQKKLGRRKVSKALTLKETERHIVNLERKLKEVIEERAPMSGKVVMVDKGDGCIYPATFEDIKRDFAIKQMSFFASNTGTGKKRYNIPADIEASLENVSQQSCRLVILNRSEIKSGLSKLPRLFKTSKDRSQHTAYSNSHLESLLTTPFEGDGLDLGVAQQHKTPSKHCHHFARTQNGVQTTPRMNTTPRTPSVKGHHSHRTPSKACKQLPFSQTSGFTPVKLPLGLESHDPMLSFPTTPAKSTLGSPFSCFSIPETPGSFFNGVEYFELTDEEEVPSLLCTESIDTIDLEDAHNDLNTDNTKMCVTGRSEFRCRRRLDQSFPSAEVDQTVPSGLFSDKSCLDFDGYMLFYQHHMVTMDTNSSLSDKALSIAKLWENLEAEDRTAYAHMATSENTDNSSNLSADLIGIDLKPLVKEHTVKGVSDDSHVVPDMYSALPTSVLSDDEDLGLHFMSDYGDLGEVKSDDIKKDNKRPRFDTTAADEDSQVVPNLAVF